jgi:hypothetical protein
MATLNDNTSCPSVLDLWQHVQNMQKYDDSGWIAAHTADCSDCAVVVRNLRSAPLAPEGVPGVLKSLPIPDAIRDASLVAAARVQELLALPVPPRVTFGQIWSTVPAGDVPDREAQEIAYEPRLVITLSEEPRGVSSQDEGIAVAPLSLELAYQADRDLRVPVEASPLGYEFMIEVWNEITLLKEQLGRYLGNLEQPFKRRLSLLCQAQLGIEVHLRPLAAYLGPPVSAEEDPRVAFEEAEHAACEYLREPFLARLGGAEREETTAARPISAMTDAHRSSPRAR